MQIAPLSRSEKSLVLASMQGNQGISAVARPLRRLFGLCGDAVCQGLLAATAVGANSKNGGDLAALIAHSKVKKRKGGRVDNDGTTKVTDEVKEGGRTLSGINRVTGRGNRCYWSNSEHHLLPECTLENMPKCNRLSY